MTNADGGDQRSLCGPGGERSVHQTSGCSPRAGGGGCVGHHLDEARVIDRHK